MNPTETRGTVRDVPLERMIARLPDPLRRVVAVFRFEFRRTRTVARTAVWGVLISFPVGVMALFRLQSSRLGRSMEEEVWGIALYGLIPQVVCLLGLLLWVAPLLNAELEGRTWIYLAVRPGGKSAVLLGKYFNGVLWTATAALIGLTLAFYVGQPDVYDRSKLYAVMCLLIACSCCAYGSVYALLGVLFPRRAIVISVGYMLIFEVLVSNIPAVINKFTIQFRLLSILLTSMDWHFPSDAPFEQSDKPIWWHLAALAILTGAYLFAALAALRWREYATAEQNQ